MLFLLNHLCSIIIGVHDSYWTHACDVDQMNRILREKFVELYEQPILENVGLLKLCRFSGSNICFYSKSKDHDDKVQASKTSPVGEQRQNNISLRILDVLPLVILGGESKLSSAMSRARSIL